MSGDPNILLITTDEERFHVPRPPGFSLPARERVAESGTTFGSFYAASTQCSSATSVIYTGRHVPITQIFDNDTMPYLSTWPSRRPARRPNLGAWPAWRGDSAA
jgi:arylsulfatase